MDRTLSDGKQLDALFEQMMLARLEASSGGGPSSSSSTFTSAFSSDRHYNRSYYDEKLSEAVEDSYAAQSSNRVNWTGAAVY